MGVTVFVDATGIEVDGEFATHRPAGWDAEQRYVVVRPTVWQQR